MKELRKHSFLVFLLMSVAVVSIYGFICSAAGEDTNDEGQKIAVAVAVHHWKEKMVHPEIPDIVPVSIVIGEDQALPDAAGLQGPDAVSGNEKAEGVEPDADQNEDLSKDRTASENAKVPDRTKMPEDEKKPESGQNSALGSVSAPKVQPEDPEENEDLEITDFQLVDESYFDNALFIGDSRVVGFGLYSGLQNTAFYANKGFQIYTFHTKQIVDTPVGKITVPEALALQPGLFKKVYIMFGLNEMGWGTDEQFAQYYYNVIDTVKGTQPDAVIYVQSIMHVTKEVSDTSTVYSNEKIDERNELIRRIAEDEHVYYLNLNEIFSNEENALPEEFSGDGIHLKAAYIELWKQYLMAHAVVREGSVSSDAVPDAAATVSGN